LVQESKDFLPTIDRLLLPIGGPIIVEEAVAGTVIPVELVGFAVLLQLLLMLVHLGRGRSLVVIAKEAQERALQVFGHINRGHRILGVEF
jgi:hypothetical protein